MALGILLALGTALLTFTVSSIATATGDGEGAAPDWCPEPVAENRYAGSPLAQAKEELNALEAVEELRILTPDSAATTDYRIGRINVIHENEVVIKTTCG